MLPGNNRDPWAERGMAANFVPSRGRQLTQYFRRLTRWHQMDMEQTLWQMVYLVVNPSKAYRATTWHKQTKNQWARDDPAFVALMLIFMTVSSAAYAVAFGAGFFGVFKTMFWVVFVDFLGVGLIVATFCWYISNTYLQVESSQVPHNVDQSVEWLYAYDVHCNSFWPVFVLLYVVQFLLMPFLLSDRILPRLVADALYLLAIIYYYHITFLGYRTLPFLKNTRVFLFPIALGVVLFTLALLSGTNLTVMFMDLYFG